MLLDWLDRCSAEGCLCPVSVTKLLDIEDGRGGRQSFITIRFFAVGLGLHWTDLINDDGCPGAPSSLEDSVALRPVATVLSGSAVYAGPESRGTVELDEIVAVRQSDRRVMMLGYGSNAEDALYLLIDGFSGGGFAALMRWGGAEPETGFSYDPERGLLVGPEGRPRLVVGTSGCRVRLTFETGRNDPDADIASVSWWGPSEG